MRLMAYEPVHLSDKHRAHLGGEQLEGVGSGRRWQVVEGGEGEAEEMSVLGLKEGVLILERPQASNPENTKGRDCNVTLGQRA